MNDVAEGVHVHYCMDDGPPSARKKSGAKTKPRPLAPEESWLVCQLAVERRENEALRKYVDWLTKRVQTLEMKLTRNEDGNLR